MKITMAQMEVVPKQGEINFNTIKEMIRQAKHEGSDCVIFPELAISGYLLGDVWYSEPFVAYCEQFNEKIKDLSEDIIIVWGNVASGLHSPNQKHSDGRQAIYNCAFVAYNQQYVPRKNNVTLPYVKQLLPNYRIFNDHRYFVSGDSFDSISMHSPFVITRNEKTYSIGLQVCEDMWDTHYNASPSKNWAQHHLDIMINLSSSPWTKNKEQSREKNIAHQVRTHGFNYFVYVNAVGIQNTGKNVVVFDGGSCAMNHQGKVLARANDTFEPELLTFDKHAIATPYKINTNKLYRALVYAIQGFDRQLFSKQTPWIVGLSGGIDSSVSAALLAKALGSERVIGVNMPSRYNQADTINNAKQTATVLSIDYRVHSIEALMEATNNTLELDDSTNSLVLENAQARLRGHVLSTIASMVSGVIVNNGNKVETALGYCTLYGDTIGALSVLADCTKMEVFELARIINEDFKMEVIPSNLIPTVDEQGIHFELKPSAELKANQVDPMKWGYHDRLIEMICDYPSYELHKFVHQVKTKQLDDQEMKKYLIFYELTNEEDFMNDLRWVIKQVQLSVFKRIQSPPIIAISRGAFGDDLKENQGSLPKEHVFL